MDQVESWNQRESQGIKEGEDHMEDRFESISFPRIITTNSNSPYNDDVTPGKSVTSPWRPGYCPRWVATNLPFARVSEFSRWRWYVIGISRDIVSRDSTKTYTRIYSPLQELWMRQALLKPKLKISGMIVHQNELCFFVILYDSYVYPDRKN